MLETAGDDEWPTMLTQDGGLTVDPAASDRDQDQLKSTDFSESTIWNRFNAAGNSPEGDGYQGPLLESDL